MAKQTNGRSIGGRFGVALLMGIPGIVALVGYIYLTTPESAVPTGLNRSMLAVLSAINPLLFLAIACLLGAYAAPRVGLESYVIDRNVSDRKIGQRLRGDMNIAVSIGILGGVLIIVLDALMMPFIGQDLPQSILGATRPTVFDVLAYAPVRFLYGGITEELMLRFGLLSMLVFIGWLITGRRVEGPQPAVFWGGILIAAVLFGVGHLPALAQYVDLTPGLIIRTVLLNGVAGVLFGWLYWRRSLEAAMVAHGSFHVPLLVFSLLEVGVG